jgi:hypothetical protein
LENLLQRPIEELRSGVTGPMREAIEMSVRRILVAGHGSLTVEAKPDGLPGMQDRFAQLGCRGPGPIGIIAWKHELLVVPFTGEWAA